MMPRSWMEKSVGELCSQVSVGIVVQPAKYYVEADNGVKAFRSANVREGRIGNDNWVYISKEGNKINSKSILQAGDVLVVRSGYPGTACVLPKEYEGSNCIDIIFARPVQDKIESDYLCYFTNSQIGRRQVLSSQGGLAQKHLNVKEYSNMKVLLPSLPEQKKIAQILSTWDQAIETVDKLIDNCQKQKKWLMQNLLTGKKRLTGFIGEWKIVKLGRLFRERSESGHIYLPLISITGENGVVSRDTVGKKDTSSEDKSNYKRICPGDIGYNTMRMWQGVSGLSSLEGIVSPAYTIVIPDRSIDAKFMSHLFKHPRVIYDFYRFSQGLTSDTWNLKFKHFKEISVCIPLKNEQQAICEFLSRIDTQTLQYIEYGRYLVEEKKALMQQLLTGKRRVRVSE